MADIGCRMCENAHTNPELDSDIDLSYVTIGECEDGYRMMLRTGASRPTVLLVEKYDERTGWHSIGIFQPNYCPNCGRELKENNKSK